MFIRKSVGIAIASASLAAAAATGFAVNAQADTKTPSPSASATVQAQRGPNANPPQTGVCDGTGFAGRAADGTQNGYGNRYGFTWLVNYLADKLGVDADKVSAALQAYHADNPTLEPGRTLTAAERTTRHEDLAKYLADKLGVDYTKVLDALNAMQSVRQAENQAAPGGHGPHR